MSRRRSAPRVPHDDSFNRSFNVRANLSQAPRSASDAHRRLEQLLSGVRISEVPELTDARRCVPCIWCSRLVPIATASLEAVEWRRFENCHHLIPPPCKLRIRSICPRQSGSPGLDCPNV
ncbi:hypothetical protein OH76DRAFT_207344 [Lentinus brumalis]|uniref:Uncharacterized protein n=1 Tax=Lentinus brumalis TaxID=2498619 RepID=A0A371DIH0_9APHY|nr:hypothetical protein OH76DRAFT_207344 [Polyporus brumalis]